MQHFGQNMYNRSISFKVLSCGQVQLTVKDSSNRRLPRFEEPILGQVRLR